MERDHRNPSHDHDGPNAQSSARSAGLDKAANDTGGGDVAPLRSAGDAPTGAWEANDSLLSAFGMSASAEPRTIHRDMLPGAEASAETAPASTETASASAETASASADAASASTETASTAAAAAPAPASAVDTALASAGNGESHESGARIHTGPEAAAAASELGAAAFTAGSDIYFGAGQYNPGTPSGDALLRHELAHVEQTRGLEAPAPGNYRVSDPSDAAEVAARGAEAGGDHDHGTAQPGTIHRSLIGDIGRAVVGGVMSATGADKLEDFLNALAAHDVPDAQAKWGKVNGLMRATMRTSSAIMNVVGHYPGGLKADPIQSVIDIMGKDGLPVMKDVGVAFDKLTYVDQILDGAGKDAAYWLPELKAQGVLDAWLAKMPKRAALTEARLTKLNPYMAATTDIEDARKIFEQAYPKLRDDAYDATLVVVDAWGVDDAKRMWNSLSGKVPLAHVQTITGGFNLGTQEDLDGDGTFEALGFGWHHPGPEVIVMPKSSSAVDGGGTGHDMTGGDNSGKAPAGTAADPSLTHWDGTMLHEIGHGVGSKTDGNTFAQTHGDWQGGQDWDAWSQNLFDDAAATAALPTPAPTPTLPAAQAREFLAKEVAGQSYLPPKWPNRDDVVSFINTHYAAQKLVGYWSATKGGEAEYKATANNHNGARTYVWLSRGGLGYTSYKKEISDNKVSWYSISSTVEWFAEQYTNYYRTGKAATGADAATKAKLDEIDKMDATATGGLQAPPAPGGTAGAGAGGTGGADRAGSSESGGPASARTPRRNMRSVIRRMNF